MSHPNHIRTAYIDVCVSKTIFKAVISKMGKRLYINVPLSLFDTIAPLRGKKLKVTLEAVVE